MRVTICGFATTMSGMEMRMVCRCCASANPGSTVAQLLEGADHQHGADQQHQRHGHLRYHQYIARPVAFAAGAGRARGPPVPRMARLRAYFQAGIDPKNSPETSESTNVNAMERASREISLQARQVSRTDGRQQPQACKGRAHAERAAHQPEQHAFDQQFPRDARASRSQRGADGKLLLPSLCAHQQQIGDIGAGDQQDHADGGHHHPQHGDDVAHHFLLERMQSGA